LTNEPNTPRRAMKKWRVCCVVPAASLNLLRRLAFTEAALRAFIAVFS
jgi:hypothetical protein